MIKKKFIFFILISAFLFFFWNCTSNRSLEKTPHPVQSKDPDTGGRLHLTKSDIISEDNIEEPEESYQNSKTEQKTGLLDKGDNPEELLEMAMDAYQDARVAWDRGDLETALIALDEAYSLILRMKLPQDSNLNREKDDLRFLISKRIQEIYASRQAAIGENHQTIPLVENKYVQAEIRLFQKGEKRFFEESYQRSGLYRNMILEVLKEKNLPEELSWMPIIESGFKVNAYSKAKALGLWQFISSTGYRFGLKRDRWIDERMDPVKSTRAAAEYLEDLHSFFGDWTTALAAYNCGEYRVQRIIKAQRINYLDNFWDLYTMLPKETSRFVPRFIATLLIIQNPAKYGFQLPEPLPAQKWETISISKPLRLSGLSQTLGLQTADLAALNPELRHKSTPDQTYALKVPFGLKDQASSAVSSLPRWIPPEATYVIHYVRRGETVSGIASRYRTSISSIARLNQLRKNYLIKPGQRLKVPISGSYTPPSSQTNNLQKDGENLIYSVKRGDSLYRIASIFNTSVQKIKSLNNLGSDLLRVGQKLIIQSGKPPDVTVYVVKTGDTPYEIAKRYGMDLITFLSINGLTQRSKIYPGQRLWIKPKGQ